ncbi:hypothetical protein O181_066816 [Austropuccinia psidii MF-1]|uniref:Uncharacterized protein n=1 Tax=Austropuccinia psidii MF-1 TaxID=1389203 RepID=A0A9Q3ERN0_9BASI|nr:hypothetical protein [Austropuccinia psidii MF-1]
MSHVHLSNQQDDNEGLSGTRRPGRGHLGHSGGWQETEGNHPHSAIHLAIQQRPQSRGLERFESSSSAPPTPQRSFPMENGQQEVQPRIPLRRTWRNIPDEMSQRDTLQRHYGNHQRKESHQAVQTPGGERNQERENQATIQAIEKQLNHKGPNLIPSGL